MQTVFDWVTVALFIASAGLFFYRTQFERPKLRWYVALSAGCFAANELSKRDFVPLALLLIGGVLAGLVWLGTRPYGAWPGE